MVKLRLKSIEKHNKKYVITHTCTVNESATSRSPPRTYSTWNDVRSARARVAVMRRIDDFPNCWLRIRDVAAVARTSVAQVDHDDAAVVRPRRKARALVYSGQARALIRMMMGAERDDRHVGAVLVEQVFEGGAQADGHFLIAARLPRTLR